MKKIIEKEIEFYEEFKKLLTGALNVDIDYKLDIPQSGGRWGFIFRFEDKNGKPFNSIMLRGIFKKDQIFDLLNYIRIELIKMLFFIKDSEIKMSEGYISKYISIETLKKDFLKSIEERMNELKLKDKIE